MRNNQTTTFTTRRGNSANSSAGWTRNHNTVRHNQNGIGKISYAAIVGVLVLIVGLIYVMTGTSGTSLDYQNYEVENQIAELEAKKEDLVVAQARLTSAATANSSEVAMNMEDATAAGYAN